jgi:membrane fusion protein, heavy metal efflux system
MAGSIASLGSYFGVLLAVLCLLQGCSHTQKAAGDAGPDSGTKPLPGLRVAAVETKPLPGEVVSAPAHVETNPNRVARVVLPLAGRVVSVLAKIGDPVGEGQLLLEIESPEAGEAESAFLQSEAALTHDQAAATKAAADLDRLNDLFQKGAVARKDLQAAQSTATTAQAGVEQSKAGRERARRRLEILGLKPGDQHQKVAVKSPISGKVLAIQVVAGEFRTDTNASLMTIADLGTLWVASDVAESAIRFCKIGGAVDIELIAFPGETFHGKVAQIADTLDAETRTIKVRVELPNPAGRFRPEMSGKVRYSTEAGERAVIPESAVLQSSEKTFVFREAGEGRYVPAEIKLGQRTAGGFAVLSGLRAGDRIVTEGVIYLKSTIQ